MKTFLMFQKRTFEFIRRESQELLDAIDYYIKCQIWLLPIWNDRYFEKQSRECMTHTRENQYHDRASAAVFILINESVKIVSPSWVLGPNHDMLLGHYDIFQFFSRSLINVREM